MERTLAIDGSGFHIARLLGTGRRTIDGALESHVGIDYKAPSQAHFKLRGISLPSPNGSSSEPQFSFIHVRFNRARTALRSTPYRQTHVREVCRCSWILDRDLRR